MIREEHLFNLKAVIRQTGLKPDTLRAWERRYGLPAPERSSGGHRLYSQRDIDVIKWLMARQREGLSIKRAVELWRQIEAAGRDPLRAAMPVAAQAPLGTVPTPVGDSIASLRQEWMDACLAYDERRAEQIMNQAFGLYSPETVAIELVQKVVAQIGDGWYQGEVTVQQEHFCSSLAVRRLEALVMGVPPPSRPGRILVACPPHEQHVIGPLLLTFLLRRRGWEVVYLGADVPAEQLETTVAVAKPELVIMSAQQLHTAATLITAAEVLQREGVPLAYGGLIFNVLPALRQHIPGHFLGERLEAAPQAVESLMVAPRPVPAAEVVPEAYRRARAHFEDRHALIEAHALQRLHDMGYADNHVALATRELNLDIDAALALGDMDLLGTDIEWVAGLIKNYQLPARDLYSYLAAYRDAAKGQMDERGQPVIAWLGGVLDDVGITD